MARYSLEYESALTIARVLFGAAWLDSDTATCSTDTELGDAGADEAVQSLQSWNISMQSDLQMKLQAASDNAAAAANTLTATDTDVAHSATGMQ